MRSWSGRQGRDRGRPLRILTWHVHGSYLYYLSHIPHELHLPVKPGRPVGYGGRNGSFAWPPNVVEVPAESVRDQVYDVVLTQSLRNWLIDRYELLTPAQVRDTPRLHLEHDPPRAWPNDALHPVQDPDALLVHVTPFNALMWDSGTTPHLVIDHGVVLPPDAPPWTGSLERGVSVVNNLGRRGRRLGADVYVHVRSQVPLDLAGMNSDDFPGSLGDLPLDTLHRRLPSYRFFLNPIRYTSLGLAVCEAMALGLPVLGLATTEMARAVDNGVSGYVETDLDRLVAHARRLLADPGEAAELSAGARARAAERFGIDRFVRDWDAALRRVVGARPGAEDLLAVAAGRLPLPARPESVSAPSTAAAAAPGPPERGPDGLRPAGRPSTTGSAWADRAGGAAGRAGNGSW